MYWAAAPAWGSEGCAGLGSWNAGISPSLPFSPATWAGKALQDQSPALIITLSPAQALGATSSAPWPLLGDTKSHLFLALELLNLIHIYWSPSLPSGDGMGLCPSQPGKLLVLKCVPAALCPCLTTIFRHF